MSASNQRFDAGDVQAISNEAGNAAGDLEKTQKNLYDQIEALTRAGWTGPAATAFFSAFKEFDKNFTEIQKALEELSEKLTGTSKTYVSHEAEQTQDAQSILNFMNS